MQPDEEIVADNPDSDLNNLVYVVFQDLKETRIGQRRRTLPSLGTRRQGNSVQPGKLGRVVMLL